MGAMLNGWSTERGQLHYVTAITPTTACNSTILHRNQLRRAYARGWGASLWLESRFRSQRSVSWLECRGALRQYPVESLIGI